MIRPGPLLWLRYATIGTLPERYAPWVLHDTTCATWLVRHFARVLLLLAVPEVLLVLVLPTSGSLRALTAFTVGACVVLLMAILAGDVVERLARRAGYPWGTAERMRGERSVADQNRRAQAYRDRVARRRQ